jgi:large subunit ribosomal protein L18
MKPKYRSEKIRMYNGRRTRVNKRTARSSYPRLTVFRSAKHIYAQLISPEGRTLIAVSTRSKQVAGEGPLRGVEAAKRVGKAVAELAKGQQIQRVTFNRNGFLYHGRVKALADAAREGGLEF